MRRTSGRRMEETKKRPKMKRRTKFTILAVVNLTWYCIAVIAAAFFDKMVPDALTVAWFSAWTVELALLAGIKIKTKDEVMS
nr:MAG TPA: hypothetical protein [Bacteriophage sp.]